jgi:hypothetical protein
MNLISLNYNSNGQVSVQLPQGPQSDSYKIYLSVNIIDDTYGVTAFVIKTPVIVMPNDALAMSLMQSMMNNDANNKMIIEMNSNNINMVAANAIALSTMFNIDSINETNINNDKAFMRDFMAAKVTGLSISDVSSIKLMGSALSKITETPQQVSSNTAVIYLKLLLFN